MTVKLDESQPLTFSVPDHQERQLQGLDCQSDWHHLPLERGQQLELCHWQHLQGGRGGIKEAQLPHPVWSSRWNQPNSRRGLIGSRGCAPSPDCEEIEEQMCFDCWVWRSSRSSSNLLPLGLRHWRHCALHGLWDCSDAQRREGNNFMNLIVVNIKIFNVKTSRGK